MPQTYIPNPGGKVYCKRDRSTIQKAREAVEKHGVSIRQASKKYEIPYTVLQRHLKGKVKYIDGQTVLGEEEEQKLVERLLVCAEWGYPRDLYGLRLIVKSYLDSRGKVVAKFKDNLPGREFAVGFMKHHKDKISEVFSQNIKHTRASISTSTVNEYFDNLAESISDVSGSNIVNFDETNLINYPGTTKIITKHGCKYPERVINQSKSAVSIMLAASAYGELLPCYVVYKTKHMYTTWTEGAPKGTQFNCTQSGWSDGSTFEDWWKNVALPYIKDKEGKKILIG